MADDKDAEDTTDSAARTPRKRMGPAVIGLACAVILGGAGFYVAYSGQLSALLGGEDAAGMAGNAGTAATASGKDTAAGSPDAGGAATAAFVQIDPLVVSLGTGDALTHLRFRGHLEVTQGTEEAVAALMPRVMDVLNGYLRALHPEELADPAMLIRLRAQMLRRVQLVVGDGLVKDLLVSEFVLN